MGARRAFMHCFSGAAPSLVVVANAHLCFDVCPLSSPLALTSPHLTLPPSVRPFRCCEINQSINQSINQLMDRLIVQRSPRFAHLFHSYSTRLLRKPRRRNPRAMRTRLRTQRTPRRLPRRRPRRPPKKPKRLPTGPQGKRPRRKRPRSSPE